MPIASPFVLSWQKETRPELEAVLQTAKAAARSPISRFQVGALVLGTSGQAYLGTNLEFEGQALSQTVHAEQFALALAYHHGEQALTHLYVSEMPCGHCRQFLLELGDLALPITIINPSGDRRTTLKELLPEPFTLANRDMGLLRGNPIASAWHEEEQTTSLADRAQSVAERSYCPYTQHQAGVALQTENGMIFHGAVLECAAYNPTLAPLQSALIQVVSAGLPYPGIRQVVLAETHASGVSWRTLSETLLQQIAPTATFTHVMLPSLKG